MRSTFTIVLGTLLAASALLICPVTAAPAEAAEATPAQESAHPEDPSTAAWWWSECMLLEAYAYSECGFNEESQACEDAISAWEVSCYSPLDDVAYC